MNICSQVTDATIALAKKEKPIKTLLLLLTNRGILGGIAWLWYSKYSWKYESLFNILIYIIKFVVAIQYAYDLNVFAKMNRETGEKENCDYEAIPDSVSCLHESADRHPNYFDLKSQGNSPH